MDDRLSLYECIRDKISDYFMRQSYTASSDLMKIFGDILGDKMLWNLLIKGLFHHLHYIPKIQLNQINEQLSSRISELQHKQIQQREEALVAKTLYNKAIMNGNEKKLKSGSNLDDDTAGQDGDNDSEDSNKSISKSKSKSTKRRKDKNNQIKSMPNNKLYIIHPSSQFKFVYTEAAEIISVDFSTLSYVNNVSDDMWIKIFQYLDLYSILKCERTCHYFCRVTSNNPACFTNFKYSFCPTNRSYMFRHYQRLNGINDPFYRFRHSTKVHLSFWSKENYEFRLLTAFGDRFRNVRSLTIEVNRESPLVDLSQLVKKYSNFFVSIRQVVICVHGLGQPHPNPHNRMITLYKSLISFILIRCSFIRTLTLNYSLLTQCYRHVSSCLELTQILCINSKSQLFNDHKQIQDDDYSNIIIFKMNNSVNDIVNDSSQGGQLMIDNGDNDDDRSRHRRHRSHSSHSHHHRHHHHHRSTHHHRSRHRTQSVVENKTNDDTDDNKMKIIKLGNIETQIQREIKIIFYRRHVRYSFLSYFHNHIRSIHVHNSMGFSNDIESPESRRLNLDTNFGEYEFLEEMCLYNVSSKITTFVNQHCRNCPMLNKMNIIFDSNKNVYNADQLNKTIKVLLFNNDSSSASQSKINQYFGANDSGDNSVNNDNDNDEIAGLDYEDTNGAGNGGGGEDEKQTDSSNDGDGSMTLNRSQSAFANYGLYGGYNRRGLIPKLMRKYLNIITLNCDISSNVKLLTNLEKTFEAIANDFGIHHTSENSNVNSLLLQLNLFVHIHIDVECNNTDEIGKLLKLLKHKYFQCDYTSYHVIARKINVVSTPKTEPLKPKNIKSPRGIKLINNPSRFSLSSNTKSRFTFNTNKLFGEKNSDKTDKNNSNQQIIQEKKDDNEQEIDQEQIDNNTHQQQLEQHQLQIKSRISIKADSNNSDEKEREKNNPNNNGNHKEDGTNSAASTPRTANSDTGNIQHTENIKGNGSISGIDGPQHNATTLVSPSILHRNTGVGVDFEIDDGNKSDGGTSSNTGTGINFKDAMNKMKLFGKSVQKLIKSNNDPTNNNNNTNNEDSESKSKEQSTDRQCTTIPFHHTPNQILRFMKKATIHCDDIHWIHDCKYAQCSRKYRTLYNDTNNNNNNNDKQ